MPRPTKMTNDVLQKLEHAFTLGCSDREACLYAEIAPSTLYDYCQKNSEFSERKEGLKTMPKLKAKAIIYQALEDGDIKTAHKVIDRAESRKIKTELTGINGEALNHTQHFTIEFLGTNDCTKN